MIFVFGQHPFRTSLWGVNVVLVIFVTLPSDHASSHWASQERASTYPLHPHCALYTILITSPRPCDCRRAGRYWFVSISMRFLIHVIWTIFLLRVMLFFSYKPSTTRF